MNTAFNRHWIRMLLATFALGCSDSSIDSRGQARPNTLGPTLSSTPKPLTIELLSTALRQVSLRMRYLQSDSVDDATLAAASDVDAAKVIYDGAVSRYVNSSEQAAVMLEYFRAQFGLGGGAVISENEPADLATYLVRNDRSVDEILTATFKVVNGVEQPNTDTGAPNDWLAGILTSRPWLVRWAGNNFLFNYVREIGRYFECYHYPDTDNFYSWDLQTVSPKYGVRDGTTCQNCHRSLNVRRSVFYKFDQTGAYRPAPDPLNMYGHEDTFEGAEVEEPLLSSGAPVPQADRPGYYKFTDVMEKPSQYAAQIITTGRYQRCMARRGLTLALGYAKGSPGSTGTLPYAFSANAGEKQFLDRWTDKLNANGRKWRSFFIEFYQSRDFLDSVTP